MFVHPLYVAAIGVNLTPRQDRIIGAIIRRMAVDAVHYAQEPESNDKEQPVEAVVDAASLRRLLHVLSKIDEIRVKQVQMQRAKPQPFLELKEIPLSKLDFDRKVLHWPFDRLLPLSDPNKKGELDSTNLSGLQSIDFLHGDLEVLRKQRLEGEDARFFHNL